MATRRGTCGTGERTFWGWLPGEGPDGEAVAPRPPRGRILLPWLSMLAGPVADLAAGRYRLPWLAGAGLAAYAVLYAGCVLTRFRPQTRDGPLPGRLLTALAAVTYAGALAYGRNWLLLFIPLSIALGSVKRGRRLRLWLVTLAGTAGVIAGWHRHDAGSAASTGYYTFVSGGLIAAFLTLHEVIGQLRETRQELARSAVAQERLRFSRDLHDLLGHTLSVVVVKAEAARRLAPRDLEAALAQVADIEAVGRQALTEVREAVTGYREVTLAAELDRARSALGASGIEAAVREEGPPLPPRAETLMAWVVREGVTNVVRHSGASRCEIAMRTVDGEARLEITDDGDGSGAGGGSGTGLKGLSERLAPAGGSLAAGPAGRRGFRLAARLPVTETPEQAEKAEKADKAGDGGRAA